MFVSTRAVAYFVYILMVTCAFSGAGHEDLTCPTWMYRSVNGSSQCVCGVDLHKAILCNSSSRQIKVRRFYMITFDPAQNETIAGYSFYSNPILTKKPFQVYYSVPSDASQINSVMCDPLNRSGLFCGSCKEGYSPLVYSYKLSCANCSGAGAVRMSLTFVAFAFIPVTFFYIFVLLFKFNANSPSLQGFVLMAQLISQTYSTKNLLIDANFSNKLSLDVVLTLQTLYSIWNLNFFRAFGPDICFSVTSLTVLSLEYVAAFYPMFLILITYIATELHSRGFRIILLIWRPFQHCSMYFRKEWNMKSSLVNVFATFLLLSYNRLLDISFSLLMYVTAYNLRGEAVGRYLYYDSTKEFFGKGHRPFGIVAIFVLVNFNFVPFLLLLLYPMKWFQKCLNFFKLSHFALHTFVDSFAGCYKDGTEPGTQDCRYFAAFFFLLRFSNYLVIMFTYDDHVIIVFLIVCACFSIVFLSAQPYKSKFSHHNTTMMIFFMMCIIFLCCCYGYNYLLLTRVESLSSLIIFILVLASLPHAYIVFLVLKWLYVRLPWRRLPLVLS